MTSGFFACPPDCPIKIALAPKLHPALNRFAPPRTVHTPCQEKVLSIAMLCPGEEAEIEGPSSEDEGTPTFTNAGRAPVQQPSIVRVTRSATKALRPLAAAPSPVTFLVSSCHLRRKKNMQHNLPFSSRHNTSSGKWLTEWQPRVRSLIAYCQCWQGRSMSSQWHK